MTQRKDTKKKLNDADFLKQMVQTYLQEYLEQEMAFTWVHCPMSGIQSDGDTGTGISPVS